MRAVKRTLVVLGVVVGAVGFAGCAPARPAPRPTPKTLDVSITFTIPANDQGESTCTPLVTTDVGAISTIFFSGPGVPGKFHTDQFSLPTPAYSADQSQCIYHLTVRNVHPVKGTYYIMFPGVGASRGEYTLSQLHDGISGMIP